MNCILCLIFYFLKFHFYLILIYYFGHLYFHFYLIFLDIIQETNKKRNNSGENKVKYLNTLNNSNNYRNSIKSKYGKEKIFINNDNIDFYYLIYLFYSWNLFLVFYFYLLYLYF